MKKYLTAGAAMRKLLSVTALAAIAVMAFTATAEAKTRTTLTTDGVFYTPHPSTLFLGRRDFGEEGVREQAPCHRFP